MKGKFSSMWRVVIALVLVAGLSLVAAVPAAALTQPTVTLDDYTISADAVYTITFTAGAVVTAGGKIVVSFPAGTNLSNLAVANDVQIEALVGIGGGPITLTNATSYTVTGTYPAAQTLTLVVPAGDIGAGSIVQLTIGTTNKVVNPSTAGDYTLTVKTQTSTGVVIEAAVTSASYSITAPVLGGTVSVYNPSHVLMATYSGEDALDAAMTAGEFAKANYTIEVGPGTYTLDAEAYPINIAGEGLTLKSTDGAAATIIDASLSTSAGIWIHGTDDVTVEGFTVDGGSGCGIGIDDAANKATVQNNIITGITYGAIVLGNGYGYPQLGRVSEATISGNVIEDCGAGIQLLYGAKDNTISDNTITGSTWDFDGAISIEGNNDGNTISGNVIEANDGSGIMFWGQIGAASGDDKIDDNNLIEGNTISGNAVNGILVTVDTGDAPTNLVITGNDITDNDGVGILVESWTAASDAIKFNNITGNDTTSGYGLQNAFTQDVDATHNWWGTAVSADIADMIYDSSSGDTDYEPFLSDTVDDVFSATAVDTVAASLDAKDEVGVKVSTTGFTLNYVTSAAKYIDNPGAPLDNALAFYDVYVTGTDIGGTDTATLKFYAGDANALLYAWSSITDTWVAVSPAAVFSGFGGYLYVTLHASDATVATVPTIEDLDGTPFAVCGEVEEEFDPWIYDVDEDGEISKTEALNAIVDYFGGDITKDEALQVIALYFAS